MKRSKLPALLLAPLALGACGHRSSTLGQAPGRRSRPAPLSTIARKIVEGARAEVERGVLYDARYVSIPYPGGDVPPDRGACTDVLIRALRHAGIDLQQLVHEDMSRHFRLYPRKYGLSRPDPSIDHRRVSNHLVFMRRHALALPTGVAGADAASWQPGDLVYCELPGGILHCGIVSDRRGSSGLPLVIHNCSRAAEEDVLRYWRLVGHYRYPPPGLSVGRLGRARRGA